MFCPWCGKSNQDGVNYCSICGKEIKFIPQSKKDTSRLESTIYILENAPLIFFLSFIGYGLEMIGGVQTVKLFLSYGWRIPFWGIFYTLLIVCGYILVKIERWMLNKSPENRYFIIANFLGGIIGIVVGLLTYFS